MKIIQIFGLCFLAVFLLFTSAANAIDVGVCKLSSCFSGYYLASGICLKCPSPGGSNNQNTGPVTSCYISSGTQFSDASGTYTYASNCPYSN